MNINYDSLKQTVTRDQINRFQLEQKEIAIPRKATYIVSSIGGAAVGVIVSIISRAADTSPSIITLGLFVWPIIGAVIAFLIAERVLYSRQKRRYKLFTFANSNQLKYQPNGSRWDTQGLIFDIGHARTTNDYISRDGDQPFAIANYKYTVQQGKSSRTYNWGYMCIWLDRKLPHMVLDAAQNNAGILGLKLSNLPTSFSKDQVLSLEGDFNKYFTLYAPKQYERDALYVFTPDLMALLIDETSQYDVEVVDNRLYIYSSGSFNLLDEATLERLFKIVDTLGLKMSNQTDYYADANVGDRSANIVAEPGRRLKQGIPIVSIVIGIFLFIFYAVSIFTGN